MPTVPVAVAGAVLTALVGLAGCGFVGAGSVSHVKPNGFVLTGRVVVRLAADDQRGEGAACAAPISLPDIAGGAPVRVTDAAGHLLASGTLGNGIVATSGGQHSCDFPFQLTAVPGGRDSYLVAVGSQSPRAFSGDDLRQSGQAIIELIPAAAK